MSRPEDTYCRQPFAHLINNLEGLGWKATPNDGSGRYVSGEADGTVFGFGRAAFVEAKAGINYLYLGDPNQPTASALKAAGKDYDATGWHTHQRLWYETFAKRVGVPYFLLFWVHPDAERFAHKNADFYLAPPDVWLAMEAEIAKVAPPTDRRMPLYAGQPRARDYKKHLGVRELCADYRLTYIGGDAKWQIPAQHPFWKAFHAHNN